MLTDNDFNRMYKKNLQFSIKLDKYHTNHQEISYKNVKNISFHINYFLKHMKMNESSLKHEHFHTFAQENI